MRTAVAHALELRTPLDYNRHWGETIHFVHLQIILRQCSAWTFCKEHCSLHAEASSQCMQASMMQLGEPADGLDAGVLTAMTMIDWAAASNVQSDTEA